MKKLLIMGSALCLTLFLYGFTNAALESSEIILPSSKSFAYVKAKEWTKINLLSFKKASKAKLYSGYSDRRVSEMKYAFSISDNNSLAQSLNRFEIQKQRAFELAENANDKGIMEGIRERTVEQQRTMTELQLKLDNVPDLQVNIVRVQKQVAVQAKKTVRVVEGEEQANTIDKQTWTIWRDPNANVSGNLPELPNKLEYAPGTGPGGVGGRVYEGGAERIWAGGTSGGSSSGQIIEGNQSQYAPGTTNGQSGNVVVGD